MADSKSGEILFLYLSIFLSLKKEKFEDTKGVLKEDTKGVIKVLFMSRNGKRALYSQEMFTILKNALLTFWVKQINEIKRSH